MDYRYSYLVSYECPTIIYEFDDDNLLVRATKRRHIPYRSTRFLLIEKQKIDVFHFFHVFHLIPGLAHFYPYLNRIVSIWEMCKIFLLAYYIILSSCRVNALFVDTSKYVLRKSSQRFPLFIGFTHTHAWERSSLYLCVFVCVCACLFVFGSPITQFFITSSFGNLQQHQPLVIYGSRALFSRSSGPFLFFVVLFIFFFLRRREK